MSEIDTTIARATALLAGNGLALVKTMEYIQAEPSLRSDWISSGAAVVIPLLGAFSAYRMLRLPRNKAWFAELSAAATIVVQAGLWVAFVSNILGSK
ncbi:MAG: hypothetical protein R3C27_10185 [Hyphomonadaceae bacterium]